MLCITVRVAALISFLFMSLVVAQDTDLSEVKAAFQNAHVRCVLNDFYMS